MSPSEIAVPSRTPIHRIAGLMLAIMLALYLVARSFRHAHPWWEGVEAFAEAALIGGLADWFAVTALFRHPLGLPIPHTALISRNKERIATNLADFIVSNFFGTSASKLLADRIDLAHRVSAFLASPTNRTRLRTISTRLVRLVSLPWSTAFSSFCKAFALERMHHVDLAGRLADVLEILCTGDHQRPFFSEALRVARCLASEHRTEVESAINAALPWFIPDFVSQKVAGGVSLHIERTLESMSNSPDHPARERLRMSMQRLIQALRSDQELRLRVSALRDEVLDNPSVQSYVSTITDRAQSAIMVLFTGNEPRAMMLIEELLINLAHEIDQNLELSEAVNRGARELLSSLSGEGGTELRLFIRDTILAWDTAVLSEKIEEQVGNDLQFIRLNGTIVGGLVGLAIYLIELVAY